MQKKKPSQLLNLLWGTETGVFNLLHDKTHNISSTHTVYGIWSHSCFSHFWDKRFAPQRDLTLLLL